VQGTVTGVQAAPDGEKPGAVSAAPSRSDAGSADSAERLKAVSSTVATAPATAAHAAARERRMATDDLRCTFSTLLGKKWRGRKTPKPGAPDQNGAFDQTMIDQPMIVFICALFSLAAGLSDDSTLRVHLRTFFDRLITPYFGL
jgi:hypothetical protein